VDSSVYTFRVDGMHCGSCALLIDDALVDLDGVVATETSSRAARTVVRLDVTRCAAADVVAAIAELGYRAALVE
jgi:copper chaperone CopZ